MPKKSATFEESMVRLEQIVRTMEQGNATLEDSLKLFNEGTKLVERCTEMLDAAQLQIQKVMTAADGSPVMEDTDEADL